MIAWRLALESGANIFGEAVLRGTGAARLANTANDWKGHLSQGVGGFRSFEPDPFSGEKKVGAM